MTIFLVSVQRSNTYTGMLVRAQHAMYKQYLLKKMCTDRAENCIKLSIKHIAKKIYEVTSKTHGKKMYINLCLNI